MVVIKTADGGLIIRGPRNLGDKIQKSRPLSDREGQILSRRSFNKRIGGVNREIKLDEQGIKLKSSRLSAKISQITKKWD